MSRQSRRRRPVDKWPAAASFLLAIAKPHWRESRLFEHVRADPEARYSADDDRTDARPPCETLEPDRLARRWFFPRLIRAGITRRHFWPRRGSICATLRRSEDVRSTICSPPRPLMARLCCARIFRAPFSTSTASPRTRSAACSTSRLPALANTRSLRVAAGLGVIPRVVAEGQAIYADRIRAGRRAGADRGALQTLSRTLEGLMARAAQKFGVAVLIDCHSMPSRMPTGDSRRPYEPRRRRYRDRRPLRRELRPGLCRIACTRFCRTRLSRRPQQALCRRLHHRTLRDPRAQPPRAADRDQPRALLDEKTWSPTGYARVKADMSRLIAKSLPAARFARGANSAPGRGGIDELRNQQPPTKKRPPTEVSGPSLGRKRPRRASAANHCRTATIWRCVAQNARTSFRRPTPFMTDRFMNCS